MSNFALPNLHDLTLILAISGGPDSTYLFHKLLEISHKNRLQLIIAHFNHNLRGKESDQDAQFVQNLAKKFKLPFELKKVSIFEKSKLEKENLENVARKYRYLFLEKTRQKYHADFIVTAHHQDDQIETILFNFLRGGSFQSFSGMRAKTLLNFEKNAKTFRPPVLRPLLNLKKDHILKYLKNHQISYRIDSSNKNLEFKRNYIRESLIKKLRVINPSIKITLLKNADLFKECAEFMESLANSWLKIHFRSRVINLKKFNPLHNFVKKTILNTIFNKLYCSKETISAKNLSEINRFLFLARSGSQKNFGSKYGLNIAYQKAHFISLNRKTSSIPIQKLTIPGATKYPFGKILVKNLVHVSKAPQITRPPKNTIYLKNPAAEIFMRGWQKGDRLNPLGLKGTKKVQDIFTDLKIPNLVRNQIPILILKNGEILSIGKFVISEKYKVVNKSQNILKLIFQ